MTLPDSLDPQTGRVRSTVPAHARGPSDPTDPPRELPSGLALRDATPSPAPSGPEVPGGDFERTEAAIDTMVLKTDAILALIRRAAAVQEQNSETVLTTTPTVLTTTP